MAGFAAATRRRVGLAVWTVVPALVAAPGSPAHGQLIPIKTVPVAAGDQFMIFPTDNPGLGGVSLALSDRALDPYVNPAKGARVERASVSGSPGFYSVSGGNGSARTLPIAVSWTGSRGFAGGALAFQELDLGGDDFGGFGPSGSPLSRSSATNVYGSAYGGARVTDSGLSLGAGVYVAGLDALDGVTLLYTPWSSVEQSGHLVDVRVGLSQEWPDGGLGELLVVHNRFEMTHEIRDDFLQRPWIEPVETIWPGRPPPTLALERVEKDETTTWGVHLGYQRPLGARGWRVGGILTGNWKSHPKIPDYDIMNIPRDPGSSWAYHVGAGLAYERDGTTFGVDLIYEPIWSDTWVEAIEPTNTASGRTLPPGSRTLENDFRFSNALLRSGVGKEIGRWMGQLGLEVRSFSYELEQVDFVRQTFRDQHEDWLEWTPTLGLRVRFDDLALQYAGSVTTGAGRPGTTRSGVDFEAAGPGFDVGVNYLAAPEGPLTLQDARVMSHRLTVAVPLG